MSAESHGLPGVLGEIADLVGIEAALAVAEKVGGTRAFFPRRPSANNWLIRAVGEEKALQICAHFADGHGGVEIDVPLGPAGSYNRQRAQRARRIAELEAEGYGTSDIARRVGITRRGAQIHRARRRERDTRQGDLDL